METKIISRLNDFGESFERQHSSYGSEFVKKMIENGGIYTSARGVTYRIPTHFGFCYGVEKSIDMAFETTRRFPDRRIFLTHDVIHNPTVNRDLQEKKGVGVLERDAEGHLVLDAVSPSDIVVIAAFGTRSNDMESLKSRECVVVDTTCGAIVMVWKRVEKYAKAGHASVIHGIWDHEETQATASQAAQFGGHFIIVRDLEDVRRIGSFLKGTLTRDEFLQIFRHRASGGFDPSEHLKRVGIASQTTMLKSETLEVQEALKAIYSEVFGKENLKSCFMLYDTICSATQERQDALKGLLEAPADLVLIIGGFNSSNTTHLSEIALHQFPTYHIRGPEDILTPSEIRHLSPSNLKIIETSSWLPKDAKRIAISTGASTPDVLIEKVIARVEECLTGPGPGGHVSYERDI